MISAVIIALNEEIRIEDCIKSAFLVADEVLVCDTGSSDNTIEVAQNCGAKIIKTDWKGFAETKNHANSHAKHTYILSLDADERLSPELVKSILHSKNNLKGVYSMNRLNNYCGKWIKHGGWYPDVKVRLFPKEVVFWEGDGSHETLNSSSVSIEHLKGDLLHYTYQTKEQLASKTEKYASLAAATMKQKSKWSLFIKMLFSPVFRFIKMYFLKIGFLDGFAGFTIAKYASKEVYLKYYKALFNRV